VISGIPQGSTLGFLDLCKWYTVTSEAWNLGLVSWWCLQCDMLWRWPLLLSQIFCKDFRSSHHWVWDFFCILYVHVHDSQALAFPQVCSGIALIECSLHLWVQHSQMSFNVQSQRYIKAPPVLLENDYLICNCSYLLLCLLSLSLNICVAMSVYCTVHTVYACVPRMRGFVQLFWSIKQSTHLAKNCDILHTELWFPNAHPLTFIN